MLTKSQLKAVFAQYGFSPLKRFGENYLIDGNIKDKIIAALDVSKNDTALEIGPGLGALTIDLARAGGHVFAVEKDRKALEILKNLVGQDFPDLELLNEDILKFDIKKTKTSKKIKVVGNLPYYITTPVIEWLIGNRASISCAVIMVQREVALRMLAGPGTKDYSAFSCFVQYYTKPEYIHTVKRTCFYPAPEVDSALVRLDIPGKPSIEVDDEAAFFRVVRGAFNQRRKSIINSLSRKTVLDISKEKLSAILSRVGISPTARPETLSLPDFAKIANSIRRVRPPF